MGQKQKHGIELALDLIFLHDYFMEILNKQK